MKEARVFLSCLKEIERNYLYLPKSVRIRIEKWIEKVALSGGTNAIWNNHRNMYTRLLLGMILARNLKSPFDAFPPDHALPPFPSHLNPLLKDLQGPHESNFWRELYY